LRKNFKILFLLIAVVFTVSRSGEVTAGSFGQSSDYLRYGVGARSLAMGGAYVALADDPTAAYWNPASLTLSNGYQMLSMHAPFFYDTSLNYIGYVHPFGRNLRVSAANVFLFSGGYEKRSYVNEIIEDDLNIMKNTSIISLAYNLRDLAGRNSELRKVSLGASFKLAHEDIMEYTGTGYGADFGIIYRPIELINVGFSVQNAIRPSIVLVESDNEYNTNFRLGTSLRTPGDSLRLNVDMNKMLDQDTYYCIGAEYCIIERIFLRAGFNHKNSLTYGIGLRDDTIIPFNFNYSFSDHKLGGLHRMGMMIEFGNIYTASAKALVDKPSGVYELRGIDNEIRFSLSCADFDIEKWKFLIVNDESEKIREYSGRSTPPEFIKWDVNDSYGRPVLPGDYEYIFKVVYGDGEKWISENPLTLKHPGFKGLDNQYLDFKLKLD